jgi:DNA modification methylase
VNIVQIDIDKLIPYARNSRTHSDAQVAQIAASIREFGFTNPVLVDESDGIIAGHGRVLAARKLAMDKVPAIRLKHLSEAQKRAYVIADNRLALNAGWDEEMLAAELGDLAALDFDLDLLGFDEAELMNLMGDDGTDGLTDPDDVPEPPAEPVTKPGDVWVLGRHRLMCGDSTSADAVDVLMAGGSVDLCITDPPYGAEIQYATHDDTQDALVGLIGGFFPLAKKHSKLMALTPGINNVFLYEKADWMLCWFYAAGTGRTPWGFSAWQPVLVWGKDPKLANGEGAHPDGYNWPMSRDDAEERKTIDHVCPKPVSSWTKWIERLSNKKTKTLYEPFCGSGTTLISAEKLGMSCYGMEVSPQYCDVAITRWQNFTGKQAILESTGEPFPVAEAAA